MKKFSGMVLGMLFTLTVNAQIGKLSDTVNYLAPIKKQLETKFPKNRTINLVFHGHSVPSGYWTGSKVHTLESYPHLLLGKLKTIYPYAVINVILTSIGGEWAEKGQTRFTNLILYRQFPNLCRM